ncbi:hypothetical protein TNCV_681461 [Trichonephila clavipes]|nr:hypothetical protein TNCV_681461 [Trichonephila clavipes]
MSTKYRDVHQMSIGVEIQKVGDNRKKKEIKGKCMTFLPETKTVLYSDRRLWVLTDHVIFRNRLREN